MDRQHHASVGEAVRGMSNPFYNTTLLTPELRTALIQSPLPTALQAEQFALSDMLQTVVCSGSFTSPGFGILGNDAAVGTAENWMNSFRRFGARTITQMLPEYTAEDPDVTETAFSTFADVLRETQDPHSFLPSAEHSGNYWAYLIEQNPANAADDPLKSWGG